MPTSPNTTDESPNYSFEEQDVLKATVSEEGYLVFQLRKGITLNIAPNFAIKMDNPNQGISLSLSGCGTQASMIHPCGRVFQYNSRIEVHAQDYSMEKSAKMIDT